MAKVIDKATAFKNELSGSTTNKIVCKAASHELAGPKKKHVDCKYTCQTELQLSMHCGYGVCRVEGPRLASCNCTTKGG